jgi:hypothetical protein
MEMKNEELRIRNKKGNTPLRRTIHATRKMTVNAFFPFLISLFFIFNFSFPDLLLPNLLPQHFPRCLQIGDGFERIFWHQEE